jgi:hypothetical protein
MSVVVKKGVRGTPMDCSCDALYRDTGMAPGALIDAVLA